MLPRLANSVKNEKRGFKPDVQIRGNSHVSSRELRKKRCVFEGVANDAVALFLFPNLGPKNVQVPPRRELPIQEKSNELSRHAQQEVGVIFFAAAASLR